MNYRFQLPPPIQKIFTNQQPSTIGIQNLPTYLHKSHSQHPNNFSHSHHLHRKQYINPFNNPSHLHHQNNRAHSNQKRSTSPNIKFNYVSPKHYPTNHHKPNSPTFSESKVIQYNNDQKFNNMKQIIIDDIKQDIEGKNEQIRFQKIQKVKKKITNRVYTQDNYDQIKQTNKQQDLKLIDKLQKENKNQNDQQVKQSYEFYQQSKLNQQQSKQEQLLKSDQQEQNVIVEKQNSNDEINNQQNIKSQKVEQCSRVSNQKIKQLEQINKKLQMQNNEYKYNILELKQQIESLKKVKENKEVQGWCRRQNKNDNLMMRQKQLQIKKLKNQVGLLKLKEKQMQVQINKLIKITQQSKKQYNAQQQLKENQIQH